MNDMYSMIFTNVFISTSASASSSIAFPDLHPAFCHCSMKSWTGGREGRGVRVGGEGGKEGKGGRGRRVESWVNLQVNHHLSFLSERGIRTYAMSPRS